MNPLDAVQLETFVQFLHPEKTMAGLPGSSEVVLTRFTATLLGVDVRTYRRLKRGFAERARKAAHELLADPTIATLVDRLPFSPGATVVGLGDSITDDYQSWLEILRHAIDLRRPQDKIKIINAGISGDTTSQMISRFLAVAKEQPAWILCMAGTNDARRHGRSPTKILVSREETAQNLKMLKNFAATQTSARWLWITPAPVIESAIAKHWFLSPEELGWSNQDLAAIADLIRTLGDPVVDLQALFGLPAKQEWLLEDGLHPSLEGQKAIAKAVIECLSR